MTDEPALPERDRVAASLVGSLVAERYRCERLVSEGANTVIFDAQDVTSGRDVTLKLLQPTLAVSTGFVERFEGTVRSVAELAHPNIAAIYDWGRSPYLDTTTFYVAQQQLTAGSLRDLFDRGRRLSPSQALVVGLDVCRALDFAHRRGFVHGELTPSKLVFGEDRRLRVVDIGLAALLGEEQWREPATVATHVARYASPEQALSLPIDGKTDVYALCLTLVEAVTGSLPFAAESTVATLSARVGRLMPVSADLGPLAAVLSHAGRPDPEDRSTAAEFGRELLAAAEKLPRPEPLPLLSTGLFDVPLDQLRTPEDPTGGVERPAGAGAPLVVVPLDEPGGPGGVEPPAEVTAPLAEAPSAPEADVDAPPAEPSDVAGAIAVAAAGAHEGDLRIVGDEATVTPDDEVAPPPPAGPGGDDHPAGQPEASAPPAAVPPPPPAPHAPDAPDAVATRRRRFPWKIVLPILVVAALVALGFLAFGLFSTTTHEVPELAGLDEAAAREQIADFDWVVTVETERSDDEPDAGQVIRTAPPAGEELAEGEPFLMVVSDGPVLRPLPELNGLSFADAQTAVVAAGLVAVPVEQYDEVVPAGQVISWSVPADPSLVAGAEVEPGTEVQIVTSLGPAPRTVPDLAGVGFTDAQAVLAPLGLALAESEQVFSDTVPAGAIVSQTPAAGEIVERSATISVQVSKGPDVVTLPDLSGQTYDQAAATLQAAGFTPVLVFGASDGVFQSAAVGGQPAAAGDVFPRGTTVELTHL